MSAKYSAVRPAGREHVPLLPKGFIAIRIVQLVVAVIVLGLSAFTLSTYPFRSNGLSTFTSVATMGIAIYCIVVEFSRDAWKGYNYWAVLALDIFLLVFWLVSFAIMAADIAPFGDTREVCDIYGYCLIMGDILFACLAAIAGLGGLEFVLFIISLSIHSVAIHRHRAAGLGCSAGGSSFNSNGAGDIAMSVPPEKQHHHHPQQQPTPDYPAAVPPPQPEPQHHQPQQPQQQPYAATPVSPQSTGNGAMYQSPDAVAPQVQHQQYQQQQPQYQPPQQHQPHQASYQQQPSVQPASVPPPHPGSHEAYSQNVGYQQY